MVQLICLANSLKYGDRCIAGIEPSSGQWIRPVSRLEGGRIPKPLAMINGQPIQPLDVIEIPLAETGEGYACENRSIASKQWRHLKTVPIDVILPFCEQKLLYGHEDDWLNAIPYSHLLSLPPEQRRSLQLAQTRHFRVTYESERDRWRGSIPVAGREEPLWMTITDLELQRRLKNGDKPSSHCLITLSLSLPFQKQANAEEMCYRLIAAVIEL